MHVALYTFSVMEKNAKAQLVVETCFYFLLTLHPE